MADDPKDPKGGDGTSLKDQVREVLAELGIAGKPAGGKPAGDKPPGDLSSQVAEAVRQVREGDEAARARAKTEERLAALEAAKETPEPEKQPRERRWIERVMRWAGDDDE